MPSIEARTVPQPRISALLLLFLKGELSLRGCHDAQKLFGLLGAFLDG
jgi:hypothetical protein